MRAIKPIHNSRSVMIDRETINRPDLSFRAKGILAFLMQGPEVLVADLYRASTEGKTTIDRALDELAEAGFLTTRTDGRTKIMEVCDNLHADVECNEEGQLSLAVQKSAPPKKLSEPQKQVVRICGNVDLDKKTMLKDSPVSPLEVFKRFFDDEFFKPVDIAAYYDTFIDWNERRQKKYTPAGWIASIKTAIRKDAKNGALKLNESGQQHQATRRSKAHQL